jgi:predicted metalloprotease
MRWQGRRQSGNVLDRRGARAAGGLGGIGLIIAVIWTLLGGDPRVVLDEGPSPTDVGAPGQRGVGIDDEQRAFVAVVLADTEDVWNAIFRESGARYREPKLVLFSGRIGSACGRATAAVGPFYCPADQQVYLDLSFFTALTEQLGARGDFARAYVIAHEVGHHVQNLLGVTRAAGRDNASSVRVELMADCLAGVWAYHTQATKNVLEKGDLEEALGAAAAIGDDRLQMQSQGYVVPDSFTHGSSRERASWFKRGYASGDPNACDTFKG